MEYSFIVPVYNCKDFLPGCVESICAVQASSYEILLVDDGSTDGSGTVCDQLSEGNPQVRVIHQQNQGASAARNHGLQQASGDYVIFLDADDSIEPDQLSALLQVVAVDKTIDLAVFGMSFDYYYHGKRYRQDSLRPPVTGKLDSSRWIRIFPELFAANSLSPIWNKVFKRRILLENGLELSQEMFLYEDLEYSLRCMACCDTIYFSRKVIYHYRQSEDEGNARRRLSRIDSLPELLKPIEKAMGKLAKSHASLDQADSDRILLQLYHILARGKISTEDISGIRRICRDYSQWFLERGMPVSDEKFHSRLMLGKVRTLKLLDKKTALRHKAAVWVKGHLRKQEDPMHDTV